MGLRHGEEETPSLVLALALEGRQTQAGAGRGSVWKSAAAQFAHTCCCPSLRQAMTPKHRAMQTPLQASGESHTSFRSFDHMLANKGPVV